MKPETKLKKAKERLHEFDARGSNCPICGKEFRYGCGHTIREAKTKLEGDVLDAAIEVHMKGKS